MWLYRLQKAAGKVARFYWRMRLVGSVSAIPRRGPVIVVSNHSSFLDPFQISWVFPRNIRWLITANWFYRSKTTQIIFRGLATIPVHKGDAAGTLDDLCTELGRGGVVGIFPEGRISWDGRVQRFRGGIAHVAARTGAPVVPLGLRGNFESLPRTRRFPRPTRITMHVGDPIVFPGAPRASTPSDAENQEFLTRLFNEVLRLSGREAARPTRGAEARARRASMAVAAGPPDDRPQDDDLG